MGVTANSKDVYITESDFTYACDELKKYQDKLESVIKDYIYILQYILTHGIHDELTNRNILNIISEVEKYPETIENSVTEIRRITEHFTQNVALADTFKY